MRQDLNLLSQLSRSFTLYIANLGVLTRGSNCNIMLMLSSRYRGLLPHQEADASGSS